MPDLSGLSRYQPHLLSLLRIVAALLFLEHGLQKAFGFPTAGHAWGPPALFMVATLLETVGAAALLLGLLTRPIALLLSGQMAIAYWYLLFPRGLAKEYGWMPIVNNGEGAILYCFVFLLIAAAGAGAWGIDTMLRKGAAPR